MKHFKSVLAMLLALVMVLSCVGTAFAANKADSKALSQKTEITDFTKSTKEGKEEAAKGFKSDSFALNSYRYADDEIVRAIVLLEGEPTADVAEASSEKAADQKKKLMTEHQTVLKAMAGIDYELKYEFVHLLNGFSCDVAYGDLEAIAAIDGVVAVHIANRYAAPVLETVPAEKQVVANQMVGNNYMHEEFWDGYGTVVAVLDTGLTTDHEAFSDPAGYAADYGVLTEEAVEAAELWVDGAYLSAKVPFAYDYAEMDADVTDYNGHGTHVSGSAVGMVGEYAEDGESFNATFMGAAPAAQLLAMKIFEDADGGTSSDIYFFALDDAYILGADVINMSIGAQNGFTYDSELETDVFGNIYERLANAGVILSVAAGNEYSMAYNASSYEGYMGYVGPEYTDYGTVASPSTYEGNVSVASVENLAYPGYAIEIDGNVVGINDSCDDGEHGWVDTFGDQEVEYIAILDSEGKLSLGTSEDFAAYEEGMITGKIAVVSRGEIDFETKVENAYNAGAVGCVVVNNQAGIISMAIETFEIPAVSVEMGALDVLSANGKIYTNSDMVYINNSSAALMSDFSNWGTSPMLTLDPTITSIGGQVYSSVPGGTDTYEVYSGTSMAAPNMSGTYANLLSAIYEMNPDMAKADAAELAKDLIYSTAIILEDDYGYFYSPRKQGAGLACSWNGIWNYEESAYITNAIQELGDDAEKTGVYTMSFNLKNDSEYDLYYSDFEAYVMYDYLHTDEDGVLLNTLSAEYAYYKNDAENAEYEIDGASVTYTVDGVEVSEINLAAGEDVDILVTVTLSEDMKAYFDANYPNGAFVEGYIVFNEIYEGEFYTSNHGTFLAYYGDWTAADVLEEADFRDIIDVELWLNTTEADEEGNTYGDLGYTWDVTGMINYYTSPNLAYLTDAAISTAYAYAGDNMLDYTDYYEEHIAFSTPETNGTYNYAETIYMEPYTLRNARHLIMTVTDKETGEVYYVDDTEYLPKSVFDQEYGMWFATGSFSWDGTDMEGNYVPSGTVATITYDAVLPYGEVAQNDIWGFDVTVDYTAPVIEDIVYDAEAETLTVTASDENYLQAIYLADEYYTILDAATFSSDVKGESFTATFDVSGIAACYVTALDYATNEMEEWTVTLEGAGEEAKLNFVTPYGTETVTVDIGTNYTFGKAQEPENYEFMFWAPEKVEQASEDEVWYVPEPWWFEDDSMIVTESEYTFYALYAVLEYTELDKTNYYMDYDSNYEGDWAICGWNLDSDYYFITEDPMALDANGNTVRVADISDAEMGTEYIEFFTNEESIRYTFEAVGENVYTIKSVATGKYLAATDSYEIAFVDEPTAAAEWYVVSADTGFSSLVFNMGVENAVLVYDDEAQEFAVYDDSTPYYDDYYPSEWFYTTLYRCAEESVTVLYYTTEADIELELDCYFNDFTDCDAQWYHEAVDYVAANGLMGGVSATEFAPQDTMTRAMIVTVLYREAGSPAVEEASGFSDVPAGEWYSDAVAWAEDNGVVNGVGDGKFDPMGNVTREQIATILWRYEGTPAAEADLTSFGDAASISDYALEAMTWAVSEGILNGDNGNLKPTASATRAEFACMIMRYLGGSYVCNEE